MLQSAAVPAAVVDQFLQALAIAEDAIKDLDRAIEATQSTHTDRVITEAPASVARSGSGRRLSAKVSFHSASQVMGTLSGISEDMRSQHRKATGLCEQLVVDLRTLERTMLAAGGGTAQQESDLNLARNELRDAQRSVDTTDIALAALSKRPNNVAAALEVVAAVANEKVLITTTRQALTDAAGASSPEAIRQRAETYRNALAKAERAVAKAHRAVKEVQSTASELTTNLDEQSQEAEAEARREVERAVAAAREDLSRALAPGAPITDVAHALASAAAANKVASTLKKLLRSAQAAVAMSVDGMTDDGGSVFGIVPTQASSPPVNNQDSVQLELVTTQKYRALCSRFDDLRTAASQYGALCAAVCLASTPCSHPFLRAAWLPVHRPQGHQPRHRGEHYNRSHHGEEHHRERGTRLRGHEIFVGRVIRASPHRLRRYCRQGGGRGQRACHRAGRDAVASCTDGCSTRQEPAAARHSHQACGENCGAMGVVCVLPVTRVHNLLLQEPTTVDKGVTPSASTWKGVRGGGCAALMICGGTCS